MAAIINTRVSYYPYFQFSLHIVFIFLFIVSVHLCRSRRPNLTESSSKYYGYTPTMKIAAAAEL